MRDFEIEKKMYNMAVELIEKRYPTGWGGAGVVHTLNGNYYTSVSIDTANASAVLCIETGAMLEAHKYNEKVTHCMCLVRKNEKSQYQVLSPCGICQERLRYWGEDVQLFITDLGVIREYTGKGVGKALVKRLHDLAGGTENIIMYTCVNENAIPFYEKIGMKRPNDVMVYNHVEWTNFTVE